MGEALNFLAYGSAEKPAYPKIDGWKVVVAKDVNHKVGDLACFETVLACNGTVSGCYWGFIGLYWNSLGLYWDSLGLYR